MKTLISWIAFNNDFKDGKISPESPNLIFHNYFWNHDRHVILSSSIEESDEIRNTHILSGLKKAFPDRKDLIEIRYMGIHDVIDINEIKTKIESLLLEYRNDDIDIYFSPGTSAMQISWYICHNTLNLKTRLLQTRPARFAKDKSKPELLKIEVERSTAPVSAIIRESLLNKSIKDSEEEYKITDSIKPVFEKAYKLAQTDNVSCLITGESGTGKEYLARYIHNQSARMNQPIITVNCSALGDQLLESRLFGYKKGSFTGAEKDTEGLFKQADGGTIFLDEIGDISPYMQQSLLRVIQEQEITPFGGKPQKIDVRIIYATHRDLRKMCADDKFRWDLYYRLNIVELELPPVRERGINERKEMIQFFLKKKKKQLRKANILKLSNDVMEFLISYPFPGNVRELENLIESLYVFNDSNVELHDLPEWIKGVSKNTSLNWKDVEKELIIKVLKMYCGNQKKTFETLGYGSINTLVSKMKSYSINPENFKS